MPVRGGAVVVVVLVAVLATRCAPLADLLPLEERFAAGGPFPVVAEVIEAADATPYQLYRPAEAPDLDEAWPIVAWGNGTIANPDTYVALHEHLASHGFVVIDSFSETTGTGAEIAASVQLLLDENERRDSTLFGMLDTAHIAAVGHSQGATGVINAQTSFDVGARISSVVSVALPALHWCEEKDRYDTSRLTSSFLVLGGTADQLVSPTFANAHALQALHPRLRGAMAFVDGAGHTAIEDDGSDLRGYLTAWLHMQLNNDDMAADVFVGPDAELLRNPRWRDVQRRRALLPEQ